MNRSDSPSISRPGPIAIGAIYLFYTAVLIRTLALEEIRPRLTIYLALEFLYLLLFTLLLWRPIRPRAWQHLYFVFQSLLVLVLQSLRPQFDFLIVLYMLLSFQAALVFPGQERWLWVAILSLLACLPLMAFLGVLEGLAVALLPMAAGIIFPAYATVTQEIEASLRKSQALLAELQQANQMLTASAAQVEELTAIQERNRLARELHDSVSQTMFSISLNTHSARILLERDPERVRPQLETLQTLTHNALDEMRSLIAELSPRQH
jgi:signal transduction histidine kinase